MNSSSIVGVLVKIAFIASSVSLVWLSRMWRFAEAIRKTGLNP
jgi:hypothetical protein